MCLFLISGQVGWAWGDFHFFVLQDGLAKQNEERSAARKTMSRLWWRFCMLAGWQESFLV